MGCIVGSTHWNGMESDQTYIKDNEKEEKCRVCQLPSSNAHRCLQCKMTVHAICGELPEGEEEGYGASVICNICATENKTGSLGEVHSTTHLGSKLQGAKRKTTTDLDPGALTSGSDNQELQWWLKQKIPKKDKKDDDRKQKEAKQHWGICVTCFKAEKCPDVFKLCRRDKSTISRHITRRHNGQSSNAIIKSFYDSDETVKKAREYAMAVQTEENTTTTKHDNKRDPIVPQLLISLPDPHAVTFPSPVSVTLGSSSASTTTTIVSQAVHEPGSVNLVQSTLRLSASKSNNVDENQSKDVSLHTKIDTLISEFRDFKLKSTSKSKENLSTPLTAVNSKSAEEVAQLLINWPEVKNVLDLVNICKHMRFFSGDAEKGILSVLRCETCFTFLRNKRSSTASMNPATVARKGIGGYSGSLATGLVFSGEKSQLLLEGRNNEFYKLKNEVKNHVTLAGGHLHFEALQYDQQCKKRKDRGLCVMQNLVSIALTVVKMKSAAVHYETAVASHAFTGSDVGEFGHSRKQFQDILRAAEVWCDREVAQYLTKPLPSTKLPPHYYVTCDKATPNRMTNQAVILCLMIDGQRQAVAVRAREVYKPAQTEVEGAVTGSNAPELAQSVYDDIRGTYPSIEEPVVQGAWMGTVCDGPYQATEFASTLCSLLNQEQYDSGFFSVLWDAPHFLDLAFSDVFDGKVGNSKDLIHRLVERSSIVHKIFQRGKMLNHAKEMATTDDKLLLRLTSRACSTRFTTSQYVEFQKLLVSLPLYIKTFRKYQFSDVKEYMIAGEDFLMDLCGITDILHPIMEMFVELQGLSVPCWKVVTWWTKLKVHMNQLQKELSLETPTSMMPSLAANIADIKSGVFKGTKLVPGWMVVSTETVGGNSNKTIDTWEVREAKDVQNDLVTFVTDIITSFDKRIQNCTKEMQNTLVCMDMDTLFGFLCGERLGDGKVILVHGEGDLDVHGQEEFQRFFSYICSLQHIRNFNLCEKDEEICFDPAFGKHVLHRMKQALKKYLWNNTSGQHLTSWFSLSKSYGCLKKLSQTNDLNTGTETLPCFSNTYMLTVEGNTQPIKAKLNEDAVYKSIYTDESLFNAVGVEGCVAIDIALAKGGSEAIVESYYSVMKSQKCSGGQLNETLALRSKIDWCMPPVLQADRAIREIADIFIEGDKQASLSKHALPILGDGARFSREGKVMTRHRTADTRLSFLR